MSAELQTRARETERYGDGLRRLAEHLPADDAALDEALRSAIDDRDADAFAHILLAAIQAGRRVDGRILANGAALLPGTGILLAAVVHCAGDVGGALLAAVRGGRLGHGIEAVALALAAWWSLERARCEVPAEAIRLGRILARQRGSILAENMLLVLSDLSGDPDLAELLGDSMWAVKLARADFDRSIEASRTDPLGCVPTERPPTLLSGYTVRRAVSRVGRNDPCPCGSGKKYKKCCFDNDRERLRHSSDVEGLTVEELRENLEQHLTVQRLHAMGPHDLARIDASRVDPALWDPLIRRLIYTRDFDTVARAFDAIGCPPSLEDLLTEAIELAADRGLEAVVKRLVALRNTEHDLELTLRARIMAEGLEPGPMLERIDRAARDGLDEAGQAVDLAYALLASPCPALGILVARGVFWTANQLDGWALLQELLETRDRLGLSPVDPVEDDVEEFWHGENEQRDDRAGLAAAGEQWRRELNDKMAETRRLREELRLRDGALTEMERKVRQLEGVAAADRVAEGDAPASESGARDPELIADLRRRLALRKSEVKRKHTERNQLRAELARSRREVEALRSRSLEEARPAVAGDAHDVPDAQDDEGLLLPAEAAENQPPRLPQFERDVGDDLRCVPVAVARATLRLIGRLAAGESAAFHGARRLRGHREVWRQRVGIGHRLLFRTEAGTLQVLKLITREDLGRAIRLL